MKSDADKKAEREQAERERKEKNLKGSHGSSGSGSSLWQHADPNLKRGDPGTGAKQPHAPGSAVGSKVNVPLAKKPPTPGRTQ